MYFRSDWYLFSLNHLLVEIIRESPQWAKLSGALGAREHAIFVDQTSTADGDNRYTVAAQTFIRVNITSLHLVFNRNDPVGRDWKTEVTQFSKANAGSALQLWYKSCTETSWLINGWIEFHTWIPLGPRPPHQHLLLGWSCLFSGRGCRSWLHLSLWLLQSDSHPFYLQSENENTHTHLNPFLILGINTKHKLLLNHLTQ